MGISGLLPLLKSIQKPCHLKKFAGKTIGIDAYGWLHRGTVACATELALGKPTRKHVEFSMHRVRMLLHFGISPYLVFDGDYLPSKAATESARAKSRDEAKKRGLELYNMNKMSQAHSELQKAVDVTPTMARELIEELKKLGVQYVVAPYEADAQLVYLEKENVIQGMISEDSDLLVFGAKCLLTKLDQYGECVEINRADFAACRDISLAGWTDDEFRRMAILSGCDYLANINGMGLKNAYRLVRKYKNIDRIVRMLQFDGKFRVPEGYVGSFRQAELTFLHQRVFCPRRRALVMMNDPEDASELEGRAFIGKMVEPSIANAVALGHLDPCTKQVITVARNPHSSPYTPRALGQRRAEGVTIATIKGNKPIDTFFKSQRQPLAELDPNSFTPSPRQETILRQAENVSWASSPAPITDRTAGVNPDRSVPELTPLWRKRRKLGTEALGALPSKPLEAEVQSPFFQKSTKMSRKDGQRSNKKKASEFNIWSDESLEDAMLELSERSGRIDTATETAPEPLHAVVGQSLGPAAEPEVSLEDISNPSLSNSTTGLSGISIDTMATSFANPLSPPVEDSHENLASITQSRVGAAPLPASERYYSTLQPQTGEKTEKCLGSSHNRPSLVREKTMLTQWSQTPLQRLRAGAISRSKSCSHIPDQMLQRRESNQPSSAHRCPTGLQAQKSKTPIESEDLPRAVVAGSEDAIIPDSEDDLSDTGLAIESEAKPRFNLGKFAFEG